MKRQTQLELARILQAQAKTGATAQATTVFRNPVRSYSDPEVARRERDRLFRAMPLFVGMSCRMPGASNVDAFWVAYAADGRVLGDHAF